MYLFYGTYVNFISLMFLATSTNTNYNCCGFMVWFGNIVFDIMHNNIKYTDSAATKCNISINNSQL